MQSGTCGENLTWTLEDDTLTISGAGAMENYTWTKKAAWSEQRNLIKKSCDCGRRHFDWRQCL